MKLRINKLELEISYALLCAAAVCVIMKLSGGLLWCALAVFIHEFGHLCAMLIVGYAPKKIKISLFEIKIFDPHRHIRTEKQNIFIIFFGPMFNFICFIPFFLLYLIGNDQFLPPAVANLSVGAFNSLPVMSLDGGQLIYILLLKRVSPYRAERVVDIMTFISIFPLAALGFAVLFDSKYNFSLLFVCVYLIISLVTRGNGVSDGG